MDASTFGLVRQRLGAERWKELEGALNRTAEMVRQAGVVEFGAVVAGDPPLVITVQPRQSRRSK